jgi:hypothetical protein
MSSKALLTRRASIDKTEFRRTCAKFPTGVTIVTVLDAEGSPHGMTASSFTSVSLDPPLVLVCVDFRAKVLHAGYREGRPLVYFGSGYHNLHGAAGG